MLLTVQNLCFGKIHRSTIRLTCVGYFWQQMNSELLKSGKCEYLCNFVKGPVAVAKRLGKIKSKMAG